MNAIILAAGLGSRFKDVTKNNHKALLPINGTPNIDRTIQFLIEAGISEIIIVTGHMSCLFDRLKNQYGCKLIHNNKYATYNNRYSMYLALPFLGDSYVIDADVVLFHNIFLSNPKHSFYITIQRESGSDVEWCPITNERGYVERMLITNEHMPSMLGISYWNHVDTKLIKEVFSNYVDEAQLLEQKFYWDDIPVALLAKLHVGVKEISYDDAAEMDTVENYEDICKRYNYIE